MSVAYTDILAMPFPILGAAVVVTAAQHPSRIRWVASGLVGVLALAVGFVLKTTPAVSLVALATVVLLVATSASSSRGATSPSGQRERHPPRLLLPRRLVGAAAVVLVGAAVFLGAAAVLQHQALQQTGLDAARVDTTRSPPVVWWVAMGTNVSAGPNARYGAYDGEMGAATTDLSPAGVRTYSTNLLRSRLAHYGALGYAGFVAKKYAWNWGDAMFWAYEEGHDATRPVLAHGPLTSWATSWNNPRALTTWHALT